MLINYTLYNTQLHILCLLIGYLSMVPTVNADFSEMQNKHQELKASLVNNVYQLPIHIASTSEKESQQGNIYGIVYQPYRTIRNVLTTPAIWCEIAPQHLNIKACTYQHKNSHCLITFYSGRKYYEEPEDTYKLAYDYSVTVQQDKYFHSLLDAKDGPLGTSNYKIFVEAIPLDDKSSFIHFGYSYHQGMLARLAMNTYLSTLGRNKIGFTITGADEEGNPVYIGGIRGVIERNVIRYYFAIQSYINNLQLMPDKQFSARISNWFDLTEKYHAQLYELDKQDYLQYKQDERINQLKLQNEINTNPAECSQPATWPAE